MFIYLLLSLLPIDSRRDRIISFESSRYAYLPGRISGIRYGQQLLLESVMPTKRTNEREQSSLGELAVQ